MKRFKRYSVLFVVLIILAVATFAFIKIKDYKSTLKEAETNIQKAQQFEILNESIENERSRCQEFVSQEEGEFGQFEYCKNFLDWSQSLDPKPVQ